MVRHGNQSRAVTDIDGFAPALHVGEAVTHRQPQGIPCRTSPFQVVIAHPRLVTPSRSMPIPSCGTAQTGGVTAGTGSIRKMGSSINCHYPYMLTIVSWLL